MDMDLQEHEEHIRRYMQEREGMPPPPAGEIGAKVKRARNEREEQETSQSGNGTGGAGPVTDPPREMNYRTNAGQLRGMRQESRRGSFRQEVNKTMKQFGGRGPQKNQN